jgi:hypothetical protein
MKTGEAGVHSANPTPKLHRRQPAWSLTGGETAIYEVPPCLTKCGPLSKAWPYFRAAGLFATCVAS